MSSLTMLLFVGLHFLPIAETSPLPSSYACDNYNGNYTNGSDYTTNLNIALSNISDICSESSDGLYSYGRYPDKVNAMGICGGEIEPDDCRSCLHNATILLGTICPNQMEAFGCYKYCQLGYSNRSMLGIRKDESLMAWFRVANATDGDEFNQRLSNLLERLRNEAASDDSRLKYAADSGTGLVFQTLYAFEQCTFNLIQRDCSDCLGKLISYIPTCCDNRLGAGVAQPGCRIRFDVFLFFESYSQGPSQNNTSIQGHDLHKK